MMAPTERRSYKGGWVVAAILLAVVLVVQVSPRMGARTGDDNAQLTAVLGQARGAAAGSDFRGTDVTVVMGGGRLDLRQVVLAPGEEVVVDVLAVMGGVTIRVPDGWVVDTRAVPVLGGLRDQRVPPEWPGDKVADESLTPPRLVLHGAVVLGGIRITS
jgi:hypothetical protein